MVTHRYLGLAQVPSPNCMKYTCRVECLGCGYV
jgi:hypothetical protein